MPPFIYNSRNLYQLLRKEVAAEKDISTTVEIYISY